MKQKTMGMAVAGVVMWLIGTGVFGGHFASAASASQTEDTTKTPQTTKNMLRESKIAMLDWNQST